MKQSICFALALVTLGTDAALAYGPIGHEIVGAIADERLANTATGKKVNALLDGISLEKAAVIPDEIKGWDKKGADDAPFHYASHPKIDAQLQDFWRANQPTHDDNSAMPSHHWFHYTDVPLMPPQKYADGKAGRLKWDIVHMIPYCVDVLQGNIPEDNERKITKPIAIMLLAHYVGDIHQPLHVGAEYFDHHGHVADPEHDSTSLSDEGGNTLNLRLKDDPQNGRLSHSKNLHGYWDQDTVNLLLPPLPETATKEERNAKTEPARRALAHEMATHEPKNWRLPANVELKKYAEAWADEIMPIAREAHDRLFFKDVTPQQPHERVVAVGEADEISAPDHISYADWSSRIVREELHKAGWRLADLLDQALASKAPPKEAKPEATTSP